MTKSEINHILNLTYPNLSEEGILAFLEICQYQAFKKKEIILTAGKQQDIAFFILKGMMRGYYINNKGVEVNIFLRPERTITGAPAEILEGLPAKYTFQSIFESHLLIFKFSEFEKLAFQNKDVFKLYGSAFKENLTTLITRVEGLINETPEERYEKLIDRNPQFLQAALNKHIAYYLGITPNSLSRMQKRRNNIKT